MADVALLIMTRNSCKNQTKEEEISITTKASFACKIFKILILRGDTSIFGCQHNFEMLLPKS